MAAPQLTAYQQGQTVTSADRLNTFEQTCDNVSQLRGVVGVSGMQISIRGLSSPNDGGAGVFYWNPAATGPDNGVNTIVPTGAAAGAWIRVQNYNTALAYQFATTTALLAAFANTVVLANGTIALTAGRTAVDDGGGSEFIYISTDTTSADNGGTIRVDAAGRRWYAQPTTSILVELFGAIGDGTTDNTTAFNNAFTAAALANTIVTTLGKTYKVNSQLTFDWNSTGFDGGGCILDFSSLSTGSAFKITTSQSDPNIQYGQHNKRPFCRCEIWGPNVSTALPAFILVAISVLGTPWFAGGTWRDVGCSGFGCFYQQDQGQFLQTFDNVQYGARGAGGGAGFFLHNLSTTNSGENILLNRVNVFNAAGVIINDAANANFDVTCVACSCDGLHYIATGGTLASPGSAAYQGNITFLGGHWETVNYDQYLIWVGSSGFAASYNVNQLLPSSPSHVPFKSDATGVDGGIVFTDHNFISPGGGADWPSGVLCDGSGRFLIQGSSGSGNTFLTNTAVAANRVPSNTFPTSGSVTTNWTGGTYDTSVKPTGATGSIRVDGTSATTTFSTPCTPGQLAGVQAQLQFTSLGAGDTLVYTLGYYDAGGNRLAVAASTTFSSAISSFTLEKQPGQSVAPPGTVTAKIVLSYVASGGGASGWIGLPVMTVY